MVAFIADIHGNLPALEAVFEDMRQFDISRIYSLGDVAGYYPLVNESIELLKTHMVVHILGNHDNYLANDVDCSRSRKVNQAINYQRTVITKENLLWLKDSPTYLEQPDFFAVHGGIHDYLEEYSDLNEFINIGKPLFLCGHTHIQQYVKKDRKAFCNPGSVGQPRDGIAAAAYALLDDNLVVTLRRVDYDIEYIANATKQAGFSSDFYEGLYIGKAIGRKGI
ncbi:MAG: metallophosphatase family protein [Oscillospiraceae bacterium]|nr:metallophosphatase family protein [Oscillospiraceae bacterium]